MSEASRELTASSGCCCVSCLSGKCCIHPADQLESRYPSPTARKSLDPPAQGWVNLS